MDNHFVPNLTFGPPVVESLLRQIDIPAGAERFNVRILEVN